MTLCNMVIEAGGKNGVVPADATTFKYLEGKTSKPYEAFYSDGGARYMIPAIFSARSRCSELSLSRSL